MFLTTDASELGWGAVCESNAEAGDQQSSGGRWNLDEQREHMDVFELKPVGWGFSQAARYMAYCGTPTWTPQCVS